MLNRFQVLVIKRELDAEIFKWLSCAVAFTMPFKSGLNSTFCILLFAYWVFFSAKSFHQRLDKLLVVIALSGVFALSVVGMIYTTDLSDGIFRLQQRALIVMFAWAFFTSSYVSASLVRAVCASFIGGIFIADAFCLSTGILAWMTSGNSNLLFGHELATAINIYPYLVALYSVVAIMMIMEFYLFESDIKKTGVGLTIAISLMLFFTTIIFLLSIRQVILVWLVVVTFFVFKRIVSEKTSIVVVAGALVILLTMMVYVPTLNGKVREVFDARQNVIHLDKDESLGRSWDGVALRTAIWTCSADLILDNFWFGTGTGDTQQELQEAYEARQFYFASRYNRYNAHNEYIQIFLNLGVIGFMVFLVSLAFPVIRLRNHQVYVSFTLVVSLCCLTESMFEVNKGIVLYAFFNPLLIFWKLNSELPGQ